MALFLLLEYFRFFNFLTATEAMDYLAVVANIDEAL